MVLAKRLALTPNFNFFWLTHLYKTGEGLSHNDDNPAINFLSLHPSRLSHHTLQFRHRKLRVATLEDVWRRRLPSGGSKMSRAPLQERQFEFFEADLRRKKQPSARSPSPEVGAAPPGETPHAAPWL